MDRDTRPHFIRSAQSASPRRHTNQQLAIRQSGSRSVVRELLKSNAGLLEVIVSDRWATGRGKLRSETLLDSILDEMRDTGGLRIGVKLQAVPSALMGIVEGMLRDRFLADALGYPAAFGVEHVEDMVGVVPCAAVAPESAPAEAALVG